MTTDKPAHTPEPQYFSFDPWDGFEFHDTAEEAQSRAENSFQYAQEEAAGDGWPEETDSICWGEVRQRVALTDSHDRPPASEINEDGEDQNGVDWNNDFDRIEKREMRDCITDPAKAIEQARKALEIGESWMKHVIEDTEWSNDVVARHEHEKATAELVIVRAALSSLGVTRREER